MNKIAIITDSTANMPENYLQEYGIHTVPLKVIWDEETLDDGIDITPTVFYNRLSESKTMPTTSQVTIGEFKELFEKLHQDGYDILAVLISDALSGTMASAIQAKAELPDANITLVDSMSTIGELAILTLVAARTAKNGGSIADCVTAVEKNRENSGVVFAVDTMEFLHRGGRIGGGKRFLGTLLNIKPILTVKDGKVDALDQARTRKKAHNQLIEIVAERVAGKSNIRLGVAHANDLAEAEKFMERAKAKIDAVETMVTELSPVIGTHVGPGTIALAYQFDE